MKYLSNTINPDIASPSHMIIRIGQNHQQAYLEWTNWLSDKIIGDPMPTEKYTVEELKAMNMVGVYVKD